MISYIAVSIICITIITAHQTFHRNDEDLIQKNGDVSFNNGGQSNRFDGKRIRRSTSRIHYPNDIGYLNVYIRESCHDNRRYTYKTMRFPYVRYDHRVVRFHPSWIRYSRSMPIYVNRITRHTIIYSSRGVYILPPLVNYYGKRFSIAELLAYRYVSLLKNGNRMLPHFNMGYYTHSNAYFRRGMPRHKPRVDDYTDAVHTPYRSYFDPDCQYDENERPPAYQQNSNESPERQNDYHTKPQSDYTKSSAKPKKKPQTNRKPTYRTTSIIPTMVTTTTMRTTSIPIETHRLSPERI